jgi:hypothetical protein
MHISLPTFIYMTHKWVYHLKPRSASKSPNTRCKVPTNQESNSLAPRNHVQKLKITDLPVIYWRTPLTDFCWFATDCFGTRRIYRLPRSITGWIQLIFFPSRPICSNAWPTVAPGRFIGSLGWLPVEPGRFLPRRRRFGSAPEPPSRPVDLSAASADYRPILSDFCSVAGDSLSPGLPSAPLSTKPNGEWWIHYSVELGRPNTIYMSSGPIFTFLIQFEFYPTKRPRFEKNSSPMFFKFHLVFLQKFSRFFIFSKISEFEF